MPRFRTAAIGMVAGYLAAVVIASIGGQIIMRVIAMVDPGTQTEFSVSGTMAMVLGGFTVLGMTGVLGWLLYVTVRRFLPGSWAWKSLCFSALWLVAAGWVFLVPIQFERRSIRPAGPGPGPLRRPLSGLRNHPRGVGEVARPVAARPPAGMIVDAMVQAHAETQARRQPLKVEAP